MTLVKKSLKAAAFVSKSVGPKSPSAGPAPAKGKSLLLTSSRSFGSLPTIEPIEPSIWLALLMSLVFVNSLITGFTTPSLRNFATRVNISLKAVLLASIWFRAAASVMISPSEAIIPTSFEVLVNMGMSLETTLFIPLIRDTALLKSRPVNTSSTGLKTPSLSISATALKYFSNSPLALNILVIGASPVRALVSAVTPRIFAMFSIIGTTPASTLLTSVITLPACCRLSISILPSTELTMPSSIICTNTLKYSWK